ncbi:MAG TPA: lipopolysaccharide heptosyltransferase family protein [candidate division Zixibacteria bacterium]|nr:lipopolysaccharide heptosyltransferase family protein [candidate division Zixibacteria bacterium]
MGLDTRTWHGRLLKSIEIGFKRIVLKVFLFFGGVRKARRKFDPAEFKKVLFIRHDKLGDMVISLPIFHNLKKFYPEVQIDVVCGKDNYEIVRTDPHITNIYYYHKKPLRDWKNIQIMKSENYDCVVDLIFGSSVTAVILVSIIAGRRFKLGVGKLDYAKYFDRTVEFERYKYPIIEATGRVLNLFGIDLKDCDMRPRIYLEERDFEAGREFVAELKKKYDTVVCVNLSAGRPGRIWPLEKYFKLIEMLLDEYPEWAFALNYAPSEFWKAEKLLKKYNSRVVPIPEGLNIRQVAGMMKYYDFLITPDTSLTHLASAFDLPSAVMFSGDERNFGEWGPYNPKIRAVRSPDLKHIEQLEPEALFSAFKGVVAEEKAASHEKAR